MALLGLAKCCQGAELCLQGTTYVISSSRFSRSRIWSSDHILPLSFEFRKKKPSVRRSLVSTETNEQTDREEWSLPPGGLLPLWLRKLIRGDRHFWLDDTEAGHLSYHDQQRQLDLQMSGQHRTMVENPHAAKFRDSTTTGSGSIMDDRDPLHGEHAVIDLEGLGTDKNAVRVAVDDVETSSEDRQSRHKVDRRRKDSSFGRRGDSRRQSEIDMSMSLPMQPFGQASIRARSTERDRHQQRLQDDDRPFPTQRHHQRQLTR